MNEVSNYVTEFAFILSRNVALHSSWPVECTRSNQGRDLKGNPSQSQTRRVKEVIIAE